MKQVLFICKRSAPETATIAEFLKDAGVDVLYLDFREIPESTKFGVRLGCKDFQTHIFLNNKDVALEAINLAVFRKIPCLDSPGQTSAKETFLVIQ